MLRKIISGDQTEADQGALDSAGPRASSDSRIYLHALMLTTPLIKKASSDEK